MNHRNHLVPAHPYPLNRMGGLQVNDRVLLGHQDSLDAIRRQEQRCRRRLQPTEALTMTTLRVQLVNPTIEAYQLLMDHHGMVATLDRGALPVPIATPVLLVKNHRALTAGTVLTVGPGNRPGRVLRRPVQQVTTHSQSEIMIPIQEVHLDKNCPFLHHGPIREVQLPPAPIRDLPVGLLKKKNQA